MNKPDELILEQILIGPLDNFIYFIGDKKTNEVAIVDPAWDIEFLCSEIKNKNYKIVAVILTHCHPDHTNGFAEFTRRFPVPAYVSIHETNDYGKVPEYKNMIKVNDNDLIRISNLEFTCKHVPGHSPGCQLIIYKNICIAGDAIFIDGCGRADLPGGDVKKMYYSIYDVILKLPENTIIYPGHNYGSVTHASLKELKKSNPYLQAKSIEDFVVRRMGFTM